MRIAASLLVTAGLVVSLAACSPAANDPKAADCTPTPSGSISDAVKVSGDLGKLPIVVFDSPIAPKTTERTVAIKGDGDVAVQGDTVTVQYSFLNGSTGVNIAGTDYTDAGAASIPLDPSVLVPGMLKTLECSAVGSRVVGVIAPKDGFGASATQLGMTADDSIVFVADIISIAPPADPTTAPLPKADGVDQPPTDGFPTVVLADNGRPTVTIPDSAPPADLRIAVLKKGDGAVVAAGDNVVVHYEGINWNTKEIFDESWARGEPSSFKTDQVIPGFTAALVGQAVGSQVIVIIPPDQGYGAAGRAPSIGGTDTLVFVIDILGIA